VQICYSCLSFTRDGHLLHYFGHFFTASTVTNTGGHTAKFNKPRCHLDLRRSFFSQRVIDRWNDLPQSIIDFGTINTFKNGLNKLRKNRVGFFMDQSWTNRSAWPNGLISSEGFRRAGAAAPGMSWCVISSCILDIEH